MTRTNIMSTKDVSTSQIIAETFRVCHECYKSIIGANTFLRLYYFHKSHLFLFSEIDEVNISKEILCQSKKYLMRVKHTGAVTLINVVVMGTLVAMKKTFSNC